MPYVAETEFLSSLRPEDRWNRLSRKILQKVSQHRIQISVLESAVLEMRAVLYSQGKGSRETYTSLILIKRKLVKHGISEEATSIDDYILADKLREDFGELTYFDSVHASLFSDSSVSEFWILAINAARSCCAAESRGAWPKRYRASTCGREES